MPLKKIAQKNLSLGFCKDSVLQVCAIIAKSVTVDCALVLFLRALLIQASCFECQALSCWLPVAALSSKQVESDSMVGTSSSLRDSVLPNAITFAAGASYGLTTVFVGQPLDTIKTRMQGISATNHGNGSSGFVSQLLGLYSKEGVRGLYRGGFPLMIGGSLMRSAQFGVRFVRSVISFFIPLNFIEFCYFSPF